MAENMQPGDMPPGGVVPRRDIKPLFDEIEAALKSGGAAPDGEQVAEKPPEMGSPEGTPAEGGAAIVADVLGVSMEKAQALLDAAAQMPKLAGKSPEEIAMMLEKDMNLRMQLEKNMGAGEDMMARSAMSGEGMMAPVGGPPPMEPTPGPMKK